MDTPRPSPRTNRTRRVPLAVELAFNFSDSIAAYERVQLEVPAAVGVTVPIEGSIRNNGGLTIASDAARGPVLPQKIESSEEVSQVLLFLKIPPPPSPLPPVLTGHVSSLLPY